MDNIPNDQSTQADVPAPVPIAGMTLIDYFAGMALAGLLSSSVTSVPHAQTVSEKAFSIGQAMLEERAKRLEEAAK